MSPLCPGCGCLEWIITGPWPNATWLRVPIIRGAVSAAGRVPGVSRVTWPSVEYHLASAWEIWTPGHTTHDTADTENTRYSCSNCYCYYDCELVAWAGLGTAAGNYIQISLLSLLLTLYCTAQVLQGDCGNTSQHQADWWGLLRSYNRELLILRLKD